MTKHLKSFGFTLVELMVVVSVIGILSSIVYANFGDARAAARDDVRKSALKEIQLALELYKAQNGRYPAGCNGENVWSGNPGTQWACTGTHAGTNNFIPDLAPGFIAELPMEPKVTNSRGYIYYVTVGGADYKVLSHAGAEVKLVQSYADEFARCPAAINTAACPTPSPISSTYAVYSAGGANW